MPLPDFTDQLIQETYQRVIQTDGSVLYNGTGSIVDTLNVTSSYAISASYAVSASHEIIKEVSSSFADTASYVTPLNQDVQITGSLDVSGSGRFTDGLTVTGSFNVSESIVGESDSIKTWTIDLANSIYINSQDSAPTGVWFDPTGSRMYMCGYGTNDIFEYSLTTPWDVTTATYTGKQFDFGSTNGGTTEGMYISPDGVECYAIGRSGDRISRYRFSTPWDVSTLSFSQSLNVGFGGTPRLNLEDNPTAVHFKYDGSILYFMGYTNDTIYQVPLTTPWDIDISNHGTITSQSINPPHGTPQGMSLSQDGTTLLLIGYSADRITKYSLSTPYDVRTLTQVEQSPYYGYIASTPTNIYWNETYNKAYIVGRSSDRIFQVKTDKSVEITKPLLSTNDLTISGSFNTFNTGRFLFRNGGDFGNSVNFRSTITTYTTTRFNYTTGGTTLIGDTTYGDLNFQFARNNYYPNSLSVNGATFDIIRNQFGGKGRLRIGIPGLNNESYFSGTRGIGGTTHITSDADTFDHFGSFTLGGELQVSGSSREVFLTKQEDLYSTLTPIVLDTFTEASDTDIELHTPDTGSGYSLEYSSSGVLPDDLPIVSAGNGWMQPERDEENDGYIYTNDTVPSIADYEVRATIRRQQSSDDTFWIFFRYVDEDNFYGLQIANNTSYTALWKKVGGTSTRLGYLNYYVNTSTADGLNIDVAVRGIGDKITIFYEGEYRGTWIDSDITSVGKAGFGFGSILQDQLTSQEIDDYWRISEFRVTEFPSSPFSPDDSIHYIKHGKLGIGTTSPSTKLDVNSGIDNTVARFESTDSRSRIILKDNNGEAHFNGIGDDIALATGILGTERLRIDGSNGNVGIGTILPSYKLDVSGSGNFTDGLTVTGSLPSNSTTTGQSSIGTGLIVNNNAGSTSISDFQVKTQLYNAVKTIAGSNSVEIMDNTSGKIGFFGATPTTQSAGWGVTNSQISKSFDADTVTLAELADVVGTLITELQNKGLLG